MGCWHAKRLHGTHLVGCILSETGTSLLSGFEIVLGGVADVLCCVRHDCRWTEVCRWVGGEQGALSVARTYL